MVKSSTELEAPVSESNLGYSVNSVSIIVDSSEACLLIVSSSPVDGRVTVLELPKGVKDWPEILLGVVR